MANHYIRQGAGGSDDGSDWTNAFTDVPDTFVRGDTYWLADGTYTGPALNQAESGTLWITIKKATVAAHGTETGWDNAYGDGQALFTTTLINFVISSSYWHFDGVSRSNWLTGYGMKFILTDTTTGNGRNVQFTGSPHDVTFSYVDMEGSGIELGDVSYQNLYCTASISNLLVEYCRLHHVNTDHVLFAAAQSNIVFDHCDMSYNWSSPTWHGQTISIWGTISGFTVRYCKIHNAIGQAALNVQEDGTAINIYLHGNEYYDSEEYFFTCINDMTVENVYIHHNTIAGITGAASRKVIGLEGAGAVNVLVYNNLAYDCTDGTEEAFHWAGTHDYTAHRLCDWDGELAAEEHDQLLVGDPFTDYVSKVFTLSANTDAGKADLDAMFNIDMEGNARTTHTRGAHEFGGAPPVTPTPWVMIYG